MKQQDVALIIIVIAFAAVVSFFASNTLFASGKDKEQIIVKIDPISPTFKDVKEVTFTKYFNPQAINPTRLIQIGETTNDNPFNGSTQ